jgi:hypothetical protein
VASPTAPNKPRVWETDHKIDWETCEITWITHWKDLRRGRDNYQGFGSSSGQREESIIVDWLHPPPPPPPEPPIVIKEPLFDTITPCPLGENFYCWSIFVYNPSEEPLGSIVLTDTLPEGWEGFVFDIETHPPGLSVEVGYAPDGRPIIRFPEGLPPGGWAEIIICGFGPIEPGAEEIINRVDGEMDDDWNPDTPPVPIPPVESPVPVVPEPEVELFKIPDKTEVPPGGTVIWRIGVVNTGRLAVDNTNLKDGNQTLPLDTLGRGHVRIAGLQDDVSVTLTPSTTLTNTITLVGEFTTSSGATRSYSASVSATVHVTTGRADITVTTQLTGEHSTLTTYKTNKIRDDELAEYVCDQIPKDAHGVPQVKDVKIMFNSCYGGGMLDDFQRVFGPGGACEGVPWVGASASRADQTAWGPADWWVNQHSDENPGSYWTNALAPAIRAGGNVMESFETARDNDVRGPNSDRHKEDPVIASGNSGANIQWNAPNTKHRAVVFGGKNNRLRHDNNIENVGEALEEVWKDADGYSIWYGWGDKDTGTTNYLTETIKSACAGLDKDTELVLYFNDHGDTDFDVDEFMEWLMPYTIAEPVSMDFDLHPGWVQGLGAMDAQPGDEPLPTLNLVTVEPIVCDEWSIELNGYEVPISLCPGGMSDTLQLPVDWTSIQSGTNRLEISPVVTPSSPMILENLELSSGPINEIERGEYNVYLPLILRNYQ